MRTLQLQPETEAGMSEDMSALDVLILYEDFPTGVRAITGLEHLRIQFLEADFHLNLWRFDVLAETACRQQATTEAAQAAIVMVSAHDLRYLPAGINAWLGQWLDAGPSLPCALVVSLDAGNKVSPGGRQTFDHWSARASRAGLDVFPHFGAVPRLESNAAIRDIIRRAEATSSTMQRILTRVVPCYCSG